MAENTRLAGVCFGAGAVRSDSMWAVSYWYVTTSRATGVSSSAEPLGSRLSAVIYNNANHAALFQNVPFHLKLPNLSILFHRITPFWYTSRYYRELSSSAAHHRCYC